MSFLRPRNFPARCFFSTLSLLLFFAPALAAVDSLDFPLAHYTSKQGLPQNSVKAIAPDEFGFIWLATEAGLVRFDGQGFTIFNKHNTWMSSSRMTNILRDAETGKLFAITNYLSRLDISNGRLLRREGGEQQVPEALIQPSWKYDHWRNPFFIDRLQIELPGRQAFSVLPDGSANWHEKERITSHLAHPALQRFNNIFPIGRRLFCMEETRNERYHFYEIGKKTLALRKIDGPLLQEPAGREWMICQNRAAGQVFIYCNRSLYLLSMLPDGNLTTRKLLQNFAFEKPRITSGYYDSVSGRLFLGSSTEGLMVLTPKVFTTGLGPGVHGNDNNFYNQVAFSDSTVLTGKGVIFTAGRPGYRILPLIAKNATGLAALLYKSLDGSLWTGDVTHLIHYNSKATQLLGKWTTEAISGIAESEPGRIWFGTESGNVFRLSASGPHSIPHSVLRCGSPVTCLQGNGDGSILVCTERHLLQLQTRSGQIDTLARLDGVTVRSIYRTAPSDLWLCTYEDGLYHLSGGRLTRFPMDRSNYLNAVHQIVEDGQGFFWMSTNNGLFKASKTDLLAYAQNGQVRPYYYRYSNEQGLSSNEFNGSGALSGLLLPNGYASFSSMNGMVFFRPADTEPELATGRMIIDYADAKTERQPAGATLSPANNVTDLRFFVYTPYYGNAENLELEYQLDNQEEWVLVQGNSFSFHQLSTGNHDLLIRKRTGFGNSYDYVRLSIEIPLKFWQTLIFRISLLVLLLISFWLTIRLRLRYLNRKNRMLEEAVAERTLDLKESLKRVAASESQLSRELHFQRRLNENITHDIRTPLKYLTLSYRYLLDKIQLGELPAKEEARDIYHSAEKIYQFSDQLTGYLKARLSNKENAGPVNINELVKEKMGMFRLAAQARGTQLINEVPATLVLHVNKALFEILLHNLLDNAIKHTGNGAVSVGAYSTEKHCFVTVADDGKGMTEHAANQYNRFLNDADAGAQSALYTGIGFLMIRDVLQLLKARMTLHALPKGLSCLVMLTMPAEPGPDAI